MNGFTTNIRKRIRATGVRAKSIVQNLQNGAPSAAKNIIQKIQAEGGGAPPAMFGNNAAFTVIELSNNVSLLKQPHPPVIPVNYDLLVSSLFSQAYRTPYDIAASSATKTSGALTNTLIAPSMASGMTVEIPGVIINFDFGADTGNTPIIFTLTGAFGGHHSLFDDDGTELTYSESFTVKIGGHERSGEIIIIPVQTVNGQHFPTTFMLRGTNSLAAPVAAGWHTAAVDMDNKDVVLSIASDGAPTDLAVAIRALSFLDSDGVEFMNSALNAAGWE
jgi:hypothetical protein